MEFAVHFLNLAVYPLFFGLVRPGARMDDFRKSRVHPYFKRFFAQGAA
jgi:hypothetical protein